MSFGFAIGDFLATGQLAWNLYHDCYRVARGAPQEFQLLLGEISTLSNSFQILQEDAKNPNSTLVQAGENRVRTVNEMVKGIDDTLKKLRKVAQKYEVLGSGSKPRQLWTKFKWSVEFSDIDSLRNKLVYHNTVMNLLLTSVGNSSLERVVSSTAALQIDVSDIKSYILGNKTAPIPSLSVVEDEVFKASLNAALMKNAEISQPWSTIGVDVWIEAGRWWLLRSQMELYTISAPEEKVPLSAYANLIKSSWILVDIIASHPQITFVTASTHLEVRSLSAELKKEFARISSLPLITPDLGELESQDLRIWEVTSRLQVLRPHRDARSMDEWTVASGERVLFQGFAVGELRIHTDPLPCIILFLVQEDASAARLVAQHQDGSVIMTVTFQHAVSCMQLENSVTINNDVKLIFTTVQDAQTLGSLIEATSWCMNKCTAARTSLDDLKAFVLLTAVKNLHDDFVERLLHKTSWKECRPIDGLEGGAPCVAVSMASQHLKRELNHQLMVVGLFKDEYDDHRRQKITLWSWAIRCGHLSLFELLAEHSPIPPNEDAGVTRYSKITLLGLASLSGHEGIARILLAKGADPNQLEEDGAVALHYASRNGHQEIVRLLLRHGAGIESRIPYGETSIHEAAKHGHANVLETLIEHGADIGARPAAIILAARHGHVNVMKTLIEHGADIEARDGEGCTAIIEAAKRGHKAAILLLLKAGANLLATDNEGIDARHWIIQHDAASDDLVATVYERACSIMRPSLPCPRLTSKRREEVVFSCDVSHVQLMLVSHHAQMEIPPHAVPDLTERYKRTFVIDKLNSELTFRFSIVHQEDVLDFAVGFFWPGSASLQVVGGGKRSASWDASVLLRFRKLIKWDGVELNPDAEIVDDIELKNTEDSDASSTALVVRQQSGI